MGTSTAPFRVSARLDLSGIDFDSFSAERLDEPTLRCLRYMNDVEHHTICYLRDLLLTAAHRDPGVTAFLTVWAYEEHWHGEALARVLERHGVAASSEHITAVRSARRWRDRARVAAMAMASSLGSDLVAVEMAWGAVNEMTTQAAYGRLARLARNHELAKLLRRIMRQEGGHIAHYLAEARRRLGASRRARVLARHALAHLWAPVGSGVMPREEVEFLYRHLFGQPEGRAVLDRIDRRVDLLPGLGGLGLMAGVARRLG